MAFNKKLFHLGNQVVNLGREIEKNFPTQLTDPFNGRNHLQHALMEMLDLINNIRLAIQNEEPNEEPKEWWDIRVQCNSKEILAIKEQIEVLELNYELSQPNSEEE